MNTSVTGYFVIFANMDKSVTAEDIIECLYSIRNDEQRKQLMRFFKTAIGSYGEGDEFLGLKVPQTRLVVNESKLKVDIDEIEKLIYSRWHEVRLAGFLLLVEEMNSAKPKNKDKNSEEKAKRREELAQFYLQHAKQANNWDLVDLSCPKILGIYIKYAPEKTEMLYRLAESDNLWEQRIAIVSNWMLIRNGIFQPTLDISDKLLNHPHDLIHKAVGWMLRELGKKDVNILLDYLDKNSRKMARTTLRYAIEKLPENERQFWLRR